MSGFNNTKDLNNKPLPEKKYYFVFYQQSLEILL